MIAEWCGMAVGRETLNVSDWDETVRCRIDEVNTAAATA